MIKRLQPENLLRNPISFCVLGLALAVPLSHIRHMDFWSARCSFAEFGKSALYYLLFISVIRTDARLEQFFKVVLVLIAIMTTLSLLHHHEVIYLPQLDSIEQRDIDPETGEQISYPRLRSTGMFNDPNDLAMILVVGLALSAHFVLAANVTSKPIWLTFMAAMGYALVLTKSRGGFLALFAAFGMFAYSRWGWKRAMAAGVLLLPVVVAGFAMRGADSMETGTGQSRIQLWADGFSLLKSNLVFGIGHGRYADEVGYVAHNSFVHCYVELGVLGGAMFFGCFYFALRTLWDQRNRAESKLEPFVHRRTTLAMAILVGAASSMLSLSRPYAIPTYMILGIGAVVVHLNGHGMRFKVPRASYSNARRLAIANAAFLAFLFMFVKIMIHRN